MHNKLFYIIFDIQLNTKVMYKIIQAKFSSKCAKSGKRIKKGDTILYDVYKKLAYIPGNEPKDYTYQDDGKMVQAQENAYFDNFCQQNNI